VERTRRVTKVEASVDGGRTWRVAQLQESVLSKCNADPDRVSVHCLTGDSAILRFRASRRFSTERAKHGALADANEKAE
jgi:hypothetical protein